MLRISNTVRTGTLLALLLLLAFPVDLQSAFAFPVAISFLFCNFLHNRQGFSANFGPIILVSIFFCPDFPSFQSFSPLKCAWWDCFRTRVTATLLANRVVRSGCGPLFARSTRTRSAHTRFARSRSGHKFLCTRHFGPHANRFSRDLRVLVVLKRASRARDPDAFSVCDLIACGLQSKG